VTSFNFVGISKLNFEAVKPHSIMQCDLNNFFIMI